jgi:hypothetical protein
MIYYQFDNIFFVFSIPQKSAGRIWIRIHNSVLMIRGSGSVEIFFQHVCLMQVL